MLVLLYQAPAELRSPLTLDPPRFYLAELEDKGREHGDKTFAITLPAKKL